ncbi:Meiotically up-regulated protein 80 protein [Sphaceloma murrayae]|uniref:Meiotically up-regulated protein 80 protein n=1 Tax=Sphaceloma murrayae TaxID=2082308 RepID=A0A2K1QHR9_9PEZI|nr:Meiotically up-regulated protein 80 protein [Sphaceloma murrayae]
MDLVLRELARGMGYAEIYARVSELGVDVRRGDVGAAMHKPGEDTASSANGMASAKAAKLKAAKRPRSKRTLHGDAIGQTEPARLTTDITTVSTDAAPPAMTITTQSQTQALPTQQQYHPQAEIVRPTIESTGHSHTRQPSIISIASTASDDRSHTLTPFADEGLVSSGTPVPSFSPNDTTHPSTSPAHQLPPAGPDTTSESLTSRAGEANQAREQQRAKKRHDTLTREEWEAESGEEAERRLADLLGLELGSGETRERTPVPVVQESTIGLALDGLGWVQATDGAP